MCGWRPSSVRASRYVELSRLKPRVQLLATATVFLFLLTVDGVQASQDAQRAQARTAMERAASFFHDNVSEDGAYVWAYSPDLAVRRGEGGEVAGDVSWNQPPGTPGIGAAYLRIYQVTGEARWLEAAHEAARILVSTQLKSGGWAYYSETGEASRQNWCYRDIGAKACKNIEGNDYKNRTILDDNTTQSVLGFLMWFDELSRGADPVVSEAVDYGLRRLIKSQYANGSFPVFSDWDEGLDQVQPSLRASLPSGEWKRTWVKPNSPPYFVVNDDCLRDVISVLLYAEQRYGRPEYFEAAMRAGEFLLAAQLPAPQRGWAQTYDRNMQPVWGRVFEPPAVASRETAGAVQGMLMLYQRSGDARFLQAAKEAVAWLRKVRLDDGDWARFYELGTDRPLYVNSSNEITYNDDDLLDHYNLKNMYGIPTVIDLTDQAVAGKNDEAFSYWSTPEDSWSDKRLEERVASLISTLDNRGRWIEDGWIKSQTFIDAIDALTRYVGSAPKTESTGKPSVLN